MILFKDINGFYKFIMFEDICDDTPWVPPECRNGGYQNPNNCSECLCPEGYSAPSCDHVEKGEMQGEGIPMTS